MTFSAAAPGSRFRLTLLLGFLAAVGPVSTDIYLPAFPALELSLHGRVGSAQITLASWFAGLGIGQLTQGSLSDRFGRRTPLIVGTLLYTLASAGGALATGIPMFSAFRALAAFGGSASMVVPRAVVRDLADGPEAARLLSRLILIMGVVPILAPALGGAMLAFVSWRAMFWAMAAYGALSALLVWRLLPDTLPRERRLRLSPGGIVARYAMIGRERSFVTHALQIALGFAAMFAYLGGSPTVFIEEYHLTPTQYGALFGLNASGFIVFSQFTGRLLARLGADRMLRWLARALLTLVAVLCIDAFTGFGGLAGLVLPLFGTLSCLGLMQPVATMGALSRHAAHAGSASALMGTTQYLLAAAGGMLAGTITDGTARPMAVIMLACVCGTVIADRCRPIVAPVVTGSRP